MKEDFNQAAQKGRQFLQKSFPLGEGQGLRWDKALTIAEAMEDEDLSRKLSLRN
jgi:hypothetical protein